MNVIGKVLIWLKDLPFIQKIIFGVLAIALASLAVAMAWGRMALLYALGISAAVGSGLVILNVLLKSRLKSKGASFSSNLVNDIKKAKEEIGSQFERAVKELKGNGVDIYQLPWYFFVGEPQSGKSFTIRSSGLNFPVGSEGISGAGGTRNCDFWFTNEAVILDTAGRLLIQKDEVVDKEQWNQVLRFLVKYRANCPINGVILGIPCTSLLEEDAKTREEKAEIIRKRLKELQEALQIRFPIFLVIMKTDLVLGFEPFFKRLPVLERKQLLGWSNEARFDQPFDPARFDQTFESVCQDLQRWRLKFLSDETLADNADQFFVFPEEFRALKAPLSDYLGKIFIKGPYGQPGFFRGYFFTSSLQEGRAIPHAIANLLGGIADNMKRAGGSLHEVQARSTPFFIRDLYVRKMFSEKGLILRTDRSRLVNAIARGAALWGGSAAVLLGLTLLGFGYYKLGHNLNTPRNLVDSIRKYDDKERAEKPLSIGSELSKFINKWDQEQGSAIGGLTEWFFPNPAHDRALKADLKSAYNSYLKENYLVPFLSAVQDLLKNAPAEKTFGWEEFKSRSRSLTRFADIGAGSREKNRFSEVVQFYGERRKDRPYLSGLAEQYETFLSYGGDPSSLRPSRIAAGAGKSAGTFWDSMQESGAPLEEYLLANLDLKRSQADTAVLADAGDPLYWWRNLVDKSETVLKLYQDLLEIQPKVDGKVREMDTADIAIPSSYAKKLRTPWLEKFQALETAWNALEKHFESVSKETLAQSLKRRAADIDAHFNGLQEILAAIQDPSRDKGAEDFKKNLAAQKERILKAQQTFADDLQARVKVLSHVFEIREEAPEGADKPDKPADKPPEKPALTANAQLTAAAREKADLCKALTILVKTSPPTLTEGTAAAFKAEDYKSFPAAVDDYYKVQRQRFAALDAPPAAAAGSAPSSPWQPEQFHALLRSVYHGALTDQIRHLLRTHLDRAESKTGDAPPASDRWFRDRTVFAVSRDDLLFELPDQNYGEGSFLAFKEHHDKLAAFLKALVDGKFPYLEKDEENYASRLNSWLQGFETRYLNAWKDRLQGIRLRPAETETVDWRRYREHLKRGLGYADVDRFLGRFKASVVLAAKSLAAIPADSPIRPPWAIAILQYNDPKKADLGQLETQLKGFFNYLDGTLADAPIASLEKVRTEGKTSMWVNGYTALLTHWRDIFKAQSFGDEYFASELLALSDYGKAKLIESCKSQFEADWQGLVKENDPILMNKFPFQGDAVLHEDSAQDCSIFNTTRQLPAKEFVTLLGHKGKISGLFDKYKGCLPSEGKPAIEGFVLNIGGKRMDFFAACQSLREFVFDDKNPESNRYRLAEVTLKVPAQDDPQIQPQQGLDSLYQLPGYGYFKFGINEGLSEGQPFVEHRTKQMSIPLKWKFGNPDSKVSHNVLNDRKGQVRSVLFAPITRPDETNCEVTKRLDSMDLKIEARGYWALFVFLQAYGTPLGDGRKSWMIRYQFPRIHFPESTDKNRLTRDPEIYFGLDLDKPAGPLPNWEVAKNAVD